MTQTIKDVLPSLKPGDKIWVLAEVKDDKFDKSNQPVKVSFVGACNRDTLTGYWLTDTQVVKGFDDAND